MTISFVTNEFNNTLNSFLLKHYNTTSTMKSSKSLNNCIYWNIGTIDSITIAGFFNECLQFTQHAKQYVTNSDITFIQNINDISTTFLMSNLY